MGNKPMYRQIADAFREKINAGELKPGDALPTESSLQEAFSVSRVTVRQALKLLADEQIIESIQGSGSYVKEERVNYDIYQLTGFYEKLADRNVDTHSDVSVFEVVKADERLAAKLALNPNDKVWHVKRVRFIREKPVNLEETWMPLAMFPDLTWEVMEQSKYHYIEQIKKMVIDRSEQELVPVMPSDEAIAALAFGTESVAKVDKIFGPGNAFVTEAKRQVSQRLDGAAIDMPAGPSEVLVIADSGATPDFVASDLLSQAEHGPDSQVILLTPDSTMATRVAEAVERQLSALPRAETAREALSASRIIVARDIAQCVEISNQYGPEHLIIQTRNARELVDGITSAGSVFLGDWSPESAGDYASGTNHVLPTYGYTATCSSLGLADFLKRMTVQELSCDGFAALASTIEILAAAERLDAHKNAVTLRVAALKEQA